MIRSQVGRNVSWYRVRVAAQTLVEAELLCGALREAGATVLSKKTKKGTSLIAGMIWISFNMRRL